mmetsp:Transcript_101947/g.186770  ORF Transcript_101947/g.186770 Transcript_101947/m.186770 type:complete len:192 (-) Transcript_101947:40-615(-)
MSFVAPALAQPMYGTPVAGGYAYSGPAVHTTPLSLPSTTSLGVPSTESTLYQSSPLTLKTLDGSVKTLDTATPMSSPLPSPAPSPSYDSMVASAPAFPSYDSMIAYPSSPGGYGGWERPGTGPMLSAETYPGHQKGMAPSKTPRETKVVRKKIGCCAGTTTVTVRSPGSKQADYQQRDETKKTKRIQKSCC